VDNENYLYKKLTPWKIIIGHLNKIFDFYVNLFSTLSSHRKIELHVDKKQNVNHIIQDLGDNYVADILAQCLCFQIHYCAFAKLISKNKHFMITVNPKTGEDVFHHAYFMDQKTLLIYMLTGSCEIDYTHKIHIRLGLFLAGLQISNLPDLMIKVQLIVKLLGGSYKSYISVVIQSKDLFTFQTYLYDNLMIIIMDIDEKYNLSSENIEGFLINIYVPKLNKPK
jgi:hypothetical protein